MNIGFIATGDIAIPSLRLLLGSRGHRVIGLVTQPDKPAGRRMELLASPVKTLALAYGVPVFQPAKMRAPDAIEQLRALAPDLAVVMAYGQILPPAVLAIPPRGCLNLHASILPRHRGAAPIQAAIDAGDAESGVAVMWMDEGLDTGDVLLVKTTPIAPDETGGSLHDRLAKVAAAALAEALPLVDSGHAPRTPQDHALATYAPKLTREHGAIDWHADAAVIERRVRAFDPWPGAFTALPTIEGLRKLKVFRAETTAGSGEPGTVLATDARGFTIACGSGALVLLEVQLEGKKRLTAADFLRGHPVAAGTKLGTP